MHPGEQHIHGEMMSAITDHFNAATLLVDGVPFTFDWTPGLPGSLVLTVHTATGEEVARYRIRLSAERIGSPRPVTTVQPAEPAWISGTWADVISGDEVRDPSDKMWQVARNDGEVTITSGTDSYTFTPAAADAVTYRRGSV